MYCNEAKKNVKKKKHRFLAFKIRKQGTRASTAALDITNELVFSEDSNGCDATSN